MNPATAGLAASIRMVQRVAAFAIHLAVGWLVTAMVYPLVTRPWRADFRQWWAGRALRVLGVALMRRGIRAPNALLVSNHVSWLDPLLIAATGHASFVCKREVRRWPVIGWILSRNDTVFLGRGSARLTAHAVGQVTERLEAGATIAVFPEGTSTAGSACLPFAAPFFQAALDSGAVVQPMAILYEARADGAPSAAAFIGEATFLSSLVAVAGDEGVRVRIEIGEPLRYRGRSRREFAAAAQHWVRSRIPGNGHGVAYRGPVDDPIDPLAQAPSALQ
jgi:1-acyl-sn-glycerol-3-phosphate acyltransferase